MFECRAAAVCLFLLFSPAPATAGDEPIFGDDFESQTTCAWSTAVAPDTAGAVLTSAGINNNTTVGGSTATFLASCNPTAHGPWKVLAFTPPFTDMWNFALSPAAGFDAVLVMRDTCQMDAAAELDCSDRGADGQPESVFVSISGGVPYYIFVGGYLADDEGSFSLDITAN